MSAAHWESTKKKRQDSIHEAGIALNILEIVQNTSEVNNLETITLVEIDIGDFSGVQIDALEFALDALKIGTNLEKTEFMFNKIPIILYCHNCENLYAGDIDDLICPGCMKAYFDIRQGKEMIVKSIHGEK